MSEKMTLLNDLNDILGDKGFFSGPVIPEASRSDESRTGQHLPLAVMRPETVEQISHCLALCHQAGQSVVTQGGMTGLAGGANPAVEDIVLSLSRFSGVEEIDPVGCTVTVRAGTILETLQKSCAAENLTFPVDYGARGSCHVGGMVATNAGGLRTIKYGTVRANVLGLEAVLPDGTVLTHLNKSTKDNTGLDLQNLIVGSEGTIAVITRVVFRLFPAENIQHTALCSLASAEAAVTFFNDAKKALFLSAFEVMWPDYFDFNADLDGLKFFTDPAEMIVIIESTDVLEPFLEAAYEQDVLVDAVIPKSLAETQNIWNVRDGHRMDAALKPLMNFDVSTPIADMPDFVARCKTGIAEVYPTAQTFFFGHMGDGNLHAVVYVPDMAAQTYDTVLHALDAVIYELVRDLGGSISAEHGIGTLKRDWLHYSRSAGEIATMRAIKTALDPKGIMNPGKVYS
tara:strand:+ start:4162 stop:5529 length:1368 start_codon:yes stop_codon:yes gene_type:complete